MNAGIGAGWRGLFRRTAAAALVFTAGAWLAGAPPALSAEVAEVEFLVSVSDGEGNQRHIQADVVPYLPDRACFGWRLRLAGGQALVRYREVLKLPEAPAFWTGEDDSYSPHKYSADRTTATTEEFAAPDNNGWISSRWCIAEGDPVGPHSIDVYIDDNLVKHFAFEVKKISE
ncbi:hypothetical protein [Pelagibius marinus]|uniref:hypothetical protein n=1 Tax=Pelagibius marinus TaxID=2762760 RepID=UPI0018731261|nr:hypothetical protein [Pelagibius marinus]